jgi:pre-mRNA-processing factor SLU7
MSTEQWGYACCHSFVHASYCTGSAGKEAAHASSAQALLANPPVEMPPMPLTDEHDGGRKDKGKGKGKQKDLDASQLADSIAEDRKRKSRVDEGDGRFNKKSRGEDEADAKSFDVTEAELGTSIFFIAAFCSLTLVQSDTV